MIGEEGSEFRVQRFRVALPQYHRIDLFLLSPSIRKYDDVFTHSGLSAE
jgi:hypothetical protein